jgi:hypothetical protein
VNIEGDCRFQELCHLRQGWRNGEGDPLCVVALDWLAEVLNRFKSAELSAPRLFPTVGDSLRLEQRARS